MTEMAATARRWITTGSLEPLEAYRAVPKSGAHRGNRARGVLPARKASRAHRASPDLHLELPRSCLGNPGKLRATVRARRLFANKVGIDWAPGYYRFIGWVAGG